MKTFHGHEIISIEENYSLAAIRRDMKATNNIISKLDNLTRGAGLNGQAKNSRSNQKSAR